MNSDDLKLFALFYIREDEFLTNKQKIQLMEFVDKADDKDVLFLLATGHLPQENLMTMQEDGDAYRIEGIAAELIHKGIEVATSSSDVKNLARAGFHTAKAGFQGYKTYQTLKTPTPGEEKPWGPTSMNLAGISAASLAASVAYKMSQKKLKLLQAKCDKEKGKARKVCYNKVRRDSIRSEIVFRSPPLLRGFCIDNNKLRPYTPSVHVST